MLYGKCGEHASRQYQPRQHLQECEAGFIEEYRWDSDIEDYVLVSRKPARKEP